MSDYQPYLQALALIAVGLPLGATLALGASSLLLAPPRERITAGLAKGSLGGGLLATLLLLAAMLWLEAPRVEVRLGEWFGSAGHGVELELLVDRLSLPFMALTTLLLSVVGSFSVRYLHREAGFTRFFFLLLLFATGMLLLTMAGTADLLLVGWELLGISSALLIAFFQERRAPSENGLLALAIYRVCDVPLLLAALALHHAAGSTRFVDLFGADAWPAAALHLPAEVVPWLGLLLVLAALGKSAQVPLSGWLPRAMEGPTPSSAIFYGALSIHAGAYLLLRFGPLLDRAPAAAWALAAVGAATALHGTFVGRVQSDAKSALAYASVTQVGLILLEIGLGLRLLALAHLTGHALVRTLQLLRAPSVLHEHHQLASLLGEDPAPAPHVELLLPRPARAWLYRLALERGSHEAALEWALRPILALARTLDRLEQVVVPAQDLAAAEAAPEAPRPGSSHRLRALVDVPT